MQDTKGAAAQPGGQGSSAAARRRSLALDAARGIAVFGILAVNIWSFVWGFETLRYGVLPDGASLPDRIAVFAVALIAEQKFYPIFAFLFGAGFALHTRSLRRQLPGWRDVRARYRARLRWLLGLGILHGALIWAGDILTVYGIAGFLILGLAGARLRTVRSRFRTWLVVWLCLMAAGALASLPASEAGDARGELPYLLRDLRAAHAVYTQGAAVEHALRRIADYAMVTGSSVFLLPHLLVLFLLGILSVRLGWVTSPERHAAMWRRVRAAGFGIGIPFNLAWASAALMEAAAPIDMPRYGMLIHAFLPAGGTLLAAAYVASIMLARGKALRWLADWLAPAGRMSLTNYLSQSVLGVVLLQGVGFGLGAAVAASPALLLGIAAAIMLCQLCFSRWWMSRHRQGPVESLFRYRRRHAAHAGARPGVPD